MMLLGAMAGYLSALFFVLEEMEMEVEGDVDWGCGNMLYCTGLDSTRLIERIVGMT